MQKPKPQAFLSYARFNNDHDRGQITEIRKSLSAAVQALTGVPFQIFQDEDIEIGENWKQRIEESLDASVFLIPIITPSYFSSEFCLDELEYFLEREKSLNRKNLILPIHYIDCSGLDSKDSDERQAQFVKEIFSRQCFDWRPWRDKSRVPKKAIRELAAEVLKALPRAALLQPEAKSRGRSKLGRAASISPEASDLTIKQINMLVTLNEYGDGDYIFRYSGVSCKPGKAVSEAILTRHTSWGQFGRFSISSKGPADISVYAEQKLVGPDDSTEAIAKVRFGEPLTDARGFVSFELKMSLYGAFSADRQEQIQRGTKPADGMGWVSFTVDNPTEDLHIVVQRVPPTMEFSSDAVDAAILAYPRKRRKDLEFGSRPVVYTDLLHWQIRNPEIGLRYELRWKLPEAPPRSRKNYIPPPQAATLHSPEDIRKILIRTAWRGADSDLARLFSNWAQEARDSYFQRFGDSQDIEISLHVLDDDKYRLKLVAGPFSPDWPMWRWPGFKPGTGLVGRAYKCNRVAFYSTLQSGKDTDAFIDPRNPLFSGFELEPYEALLSCPVYWAGGTSREDIIALVNIGSRSRNSKLHSYRPNQEFDDWLKDISKSALKYVVALITGRPQAESELTQS